MGFFLLVAILLTIVFGPIGLALSLAFMGIICVSAFCDWLRSFYPSAPVTVLHRQPLRNNQMFRAYASTQVRRELGNRGDMIERMKRFNEYYDEAKALFEEGMQHGDC